MKLAMVLATIDPALGGVLVFGDLGTGKSTAVRSLAALLPPIRMVDGCPVNSERPEDCPDRAHPASSEITERPTPVIDLPLGVTEDRVTGALDIKRALTDGEKTFEPGLLARANRGFLYIDEVNLLEDQVIGLLLDVAQSGVNVVEREGLSIHHPARFVLVGSGNPEEGELRPQLLDRFGLSVEVRSPYDIETRVEVIRRRATGTEPQAAPRSARRGGLGGAGRARHHRGAVVTAAAAKWDRAMKAVALLTVAPAPLKGMIVRARPGPARDALERALSALPMPCRRLPVIVDDASLFAGVNLLASHAKGKAVRHTGLADTPAALLVPMAERMAPSLAAKLGDLLDRDLGHAMVLFDESDEQEHETGVPSLLGDRLAFNIDLDGVNAQQARTRLPAPADIDAARDRVGASTIAPCHREALVTLAARFGISSLRAPLLAMRSANCLAALDGRQTTSEDDVRTAAALVYPARAVHEAQDPPEDAQPAPETPDPESHGATDEDSPPPTGPDPATDEMLVEAVSAILPAGILAGAASGQ